MPAEFTVKLQITGVRETLKAFRDLPQDANDELRDGSMKLAQSLVPRVKAAGVAAGAQAAAVAPTVKAKRDRVPVIQAGGAKRVTKNRARAGDLIAGSEFGADGRYGWYARSRYRHSDGQQYHAHTGRDGLWFFPTVEGAGPEIDHAWNEIADRIVRKWGS